MTTGDASWRYRVVPQSDTSAPSRRVVGLLEAHDCWAEFHPDALRAARGIRARGIPRLLTSSLASALVETARVLRRQRPLLKFRDAALVRLYRLIAAPGLKIIAAPSSEETARYTGLIHPKDTHVLAGASKAKATALITLDRKHFCTPTIRQAPLPFEILTPDAFLHRLVAECRSWLARKVT